MKALPCKKCGGPAILPDGKPYTLAAHPFPAGAYSYKCSRCKTKTSLRASEFNLLPEHREEQ